MGKNPLRGLTCRCVEEKKGMRIAIDKNFLHIFHPFAEKPSLHEILHDGSFC